LRSARVFVDLGGAAIRSAFEGADPAGFNSPALRAATVSALRSARVLVDFGGAAMRSAWVPPGPAGASCPAFWAARVSAFTSARDGDEAAAWANATLQRHVAASRAIAVRIG